MHLWRGVKRRKGRIKGRWRRCRRVVKRWVMKLLAHKLPTPAAQTPLKRSKEQISSTSPTFNTFRICIKRPFSCTGHWWRVLATKWRSKSRSGRLRRLRYWRRYPWISPSSRDRFTRTSLKFTSCSSRLFRLTTMEPKSEQRMHSRSRSPNQLFTASNQFTWSSSHLAAMTTRRPSCQRPCTCLPRNQWVSRKVCTLYKISSSVFLPESSKRP